MLIRTAALLVFFLLLSWMLMHEWKTEYPHRRWYIRRGYSNWDWDASELDAIWPNTEREET
jgi:hypothetical protein